MRIFLHAIPAAKGALMTTTDTLMLVTDISLTITLVLTIWQKIRGF